MASVAQQVKFRLSAEEVGEVEAVVPAGVSWPEYAKQALLRQVRMLSGPPSAAEAGVLGRRESGAVASAPDVGLPVAGDLVRREIRRAQSRVGGPRVARVCTHEGCRPPYRSFGDASWVCPEHGARFAVDQANRPYLGEATG